MSYILKLDIACVVPQYCCGFDVMVYITFLKHPEFWCIQHLNVTLSQLQSALQLGDAAWGYLTL